MTVAPRWIRLFLGHVHSQMEFWYSIGFRINEQLDKVNREAIGSAGGVVNFHGKGGELSTSRSPGGIRTEMNTIGLPS